MNIGFFVRHFTFRGTEVAIYDYAKYNEEILNNKSYIICFSQQKQSSLGAGFPSERDSYDKFASRFRIIEINDISEMSNITREYDLSFFYTLTHGGPGDIYQFENKNIWGNCKTIKHCVFETTSPESADFYISISEKLNEKYGTSIPIIPHMVDLPNCEEDLRDILNIPRDALVFGRYGGEFEFNIKFAQEAIVDFLSVDSNVYFLFMSTEPFFSHPRIIYLDKNIDLTFKVKFINTCDAMIHARHIGETFGLSIAEFSSKNKPVFTCPCGDLEHVKILGDKAILYTSKEELLRYFIHARILLDSIKEWNAYQYYSPSNIMSLFKTLIFDMK
jgi:hypothetical protein